MENKQKGFIIPLLLVVIVLVVVAACVYIYKSKRTEVPVITFSVSGNNLSVIKHGTILQKLTLDKAGEFALHVDSGSKILPFIIDKDVNFDGHDDVGVLTSTGYGGVNYFYDFYIFNPDFEELIKSPILTGISSVRVDPVKKQIISTYKSGPGYVIDTYQWNGSTFIKSGPVPVQ